MTEYVLKIQSRHPMRVGAAKQRVRLTTLLNISRQVIVLDPSLKINEVDVPYKAFIEQFKEHILHYIIKDKGWTITKALNYLTSKFNYDPYVYSVMQHIVTENECRMIINRNPTITFGSILEMKIRKVKPDSNDYSLAIPSAILPGLKPSALRP